MVAAIGSDRPAFAQPELMAWGNLTGMRVEGQLMEFETSLAVVGADWNRMSRTAKERQRPSYERAGSKRIVSTRLDSLFLTQSVEDVGSGAARVDVQVTSRADTNIAGAFFRIDLPRAEFGRASIDPIDPAEPPPGVRSPGGGDELLRVIASGVRFESDRRRLEVTSDEPILIVVKRDSARGEDVEAYLALVSGPVHVGQNAERILTLRASGEIDKRPIDLVLDTSRPGRAFDGLGGNFRIQNPRTDPQVIEYNLDNLRVAWGRVDLPWMLWHPDADVDPMEAAMGGDLHPRVEMAMEMAATLKERRIPIMLAIWFPPDWAILGERSRGRGDDGLWGNALDPQKMDEIYASITSYIRYLKETYDVDIEMFSFNESDLGIDVRQTAQEHAELIKGLGAYLASQGFKTRLLLGDTADARGYEFIEPAMSDPETHPYVGAVSYHSWRGWDDETLKKWTKAAERLGVPLIVGEGSIDAAAWRYPAIFEEPEYAREEINLYTRILAINQPMTILQWQLTADYSLLAGGGVFGNDSEPLRPTQRFWNMKQLASTPPDVSALPITSNRSDVSAAALGDNQRGVYAVHLVNNGTTREAVVTGLPDGVEELRVFVTDSTRGMEEGEPLRVSDGTARFMLESVSFTTLIAD